MKKEINITGCISVNMFNSAETWKQTLEQLFKTKFEMEETKEKLILREIR